MMIISYPFVPSFKSTHARIFLILFLLLPGHIRYSTYFILSIDTSLELSPINRGERHGERKSHHAG